MYNHWKCQKSKQSENDVNDKACKLPKNMNINNSIFPVQRLKIAFWNFLFKVQSYLKNSGTGQDSKSEVNLGRTFPLCVASLSCHAKPKS